MLTDGFGRPFVDGAEAVSVDDLDADALYALSVIATSADLSQPGVLPEGLMSFAGAEIERWDESSELERQRAFERGREQLVARKLLEVHGVDALSGQTVVTMRWNRLVTRNSKLDS